MTNLTNEQLAKCREAFDKWAVSPQIDACVSNQDWLTWQAAWSAAQPQWLPIDTAPKDGTPILIGIEGAEYHASKAWWDDEKALWLINERPCVYIPLQPTHWMPLPTPPEQPALEKLVEGRE